MYIIFVLVDTVGLNPPLIDSASLFTIKLRINVDVGIASVHVDVYVVAAVFELEYTGVLYPPPIDSLEPLTL